MVPELIDIHCHLDFPDFDKDRQEVIKKALNEKTWMITVGTSMEGSEKAVQIAGEHEGVWACVGVHPEDANKKIDIDALRELAGNPKAVAIGECGLDYFRCGTSDVPQIQENQKELFEKQIKLAIELNKPLMIHCRDAHNDVLEILKNYKNPETGFRGDVHCFTGTLEEARKYVELGFFISFTGIITFTKQYDEIIKELPLDKIMIETDAPLIAPVPHRGKRNEPVYVKEVAKRIAEIKGISFEEVAKQTTKSAIDFFCLK